MASNTSHHHIFQREMLLESNKMDTNVSDDTKKKINNIFTEVYRFPHEKREQKERLIFLSVYVLKKSFDLNDSLHFLHTISSMRAFHSRYDGFFFSVYIL